MPKLLIVCNTPTDNTRKLCDAVTNGAQKEVFEGLDVKVKQPLQANADDVIWADGIIIGSTEHFGAMSGLIKDFFERIYYPCLEIKQGLAVGVYVKASLDGTGTQTGIEKILTGLRWKLVRPTLLLHGEFQISFIEQCEELGLYMAAGLDAGVF